MSRGVPQGSPDLFNVYVEKFLEELEAAGIFARMFADDFIVIGPNRSTAENGIKIVRRVAE